MDEEYHGKMSKKARLWDIQGEIQKLQQEAQKLLKELENDAK